MKSLYVALLGLSIIIMSGCSSKNNDISAASQNIVVQKVDKDDIRYVMKQEKMIYDAEPAEATFSAVGEGIAPLNTVSHAQSLALAKRAAIADAHRQLAEKLYGVKINSRDTVRDAMLKDSTITAQVSGLIKNASIVEQDFKDGLYRVRMELRLDQNKWQEIFAY
ncbi:LPP20 family lipoprotein [Campylobacter sp. RM16192]|uniref:LPP20 family lipoprotein n=1 Tax=Campylobacter sp. RM16192 TaxID=1660080 RepID=UPI0014526EC8|nr:LPP20 family lipoprotein [Campylobacter sp. RM16192]QCD53165.1 LPP20 family lipoprotein [Campylobacter sp. RM16192]